MSENVGMEPERNALMDPIDVFYANHPAFDVLGEILEIAEQAVTDGKLDTALRAYGRLCDKLVPSPEVQLQISDIADAVQELQELKNSEMYASATAGRFAPDPRRFTVVRKD